MMFAAFRDPQNRDVIEAMCAAVATVEPEMATIVRSCLLDGKTLQEIADDMSIPVDRARYQFWHWVTACKISLGLLPRDQGPPELPMGS